MTRAALWLDHNEARAIALADDGSFHELAHLRAHDLHTHPKVGPGHRHPPDRRFFAEVEALVGRCDAIVLFGPSQARLDLTHELEAAGSPLRARIVAVHALDRVTDGQLAARAREVLAEHDRMRGVHVDRRPN